MKVNLGQYDNRGYTPGAGLLRRTLWYCVNAIVFHTWLIPVSVLKKRLLVAFGANIGTGFVIKPRVNIKYPWHLTVADHVWLGEGVWIDNLAPVSLGSNVCLSQDAYLLTGNHDYKDEAFGLVVAEIAIESGVWIAARSVVCPGVRVGEHAIVAVGSVLVKDAEPFGIYQGNPAKLVRKRVVEQTSS